LTTSSTAANSDQREQDVRADAAERAAGISRLLALAVDADQRSDQQGDEEVAGDFEIHRWR
jgi:hypothetical protein